MYEPREDSYLLQRNIEHLKGEVAIDMCTGTGIIANTLSKGHSKVIGIDKDKESIQHAKENVEDVEFIQHDLFPQRLPPADTITCNPPYLPLSELKDDELESPEKGTYLSKKVLEQAKEILKPRGSLFLIISTQANKDGLLKYANKEGYTYKKVDEVAAFFEKIQLYEFRHK